MNQTQVLANPDYCLTDLIGSGLVVAGWLSLPETGYIMFSDIRTGISSIDSYGTYDPYVHLGSRLYWFNFSNLYWSSGSPMGYREDNGATNYSHRFEKCGISKHTRCGMNVDIALGSRYYLYKVAMAGAGYYPVISGGNMGAPTSFVAELNSGIVTTYVTRASDSTIHAGSRC